VEARADHASAREQAQELREHALDLREQRLTGMAAEIAGQLAVGGSCPVCGSCDHPHKAEAVVGAPDDAAEKSAQRAADDAAAIEFVRRDELRTLETQLDAASQRLDQVPPDIAGETTAVTTRLETLADEADGLRSELTDYDETLLATCHARERQARAGLEALDRLAAADQAAADADSALGDAATEAGFDSAEEALDAALDSATYDELSDQIADHERRLAAVSAVLHEPGADEIAATAPPDLDALKRAHHTALDALTAARAREASWASRSKRLTRLVADLDAALAEWTPLRDELELTTHLSSFVDGKSPDNRLQMRLSAYVLAYRLSQVVAAANTRLARMSDQRYSLEHTGRRGAGETRGGLSILVRDDWSGEARDPATLSGGETFVVSLALALGLADVVTQEAGGADLDTLFVDEGFGSLDADTLDDVLDTLDSLRDGGRVVGVVSHVPEMRERIPAQLRVSKSRRGSAISIS
jgi:exonuclease SbcC